MAADASLWHPGPAGPDLSPALVPSGRIYLTGEDHLRLTTFNSAAGVTLAIEGRYLTVEGRIVSSADRHVPATDRTSSSTLIALGPGWLLDVVVRASAGTPRVGQCYALLELVRGFTGAVTPLALLAQGYVTDSARFGWPGSPIRPSTEGRGVLRVLQGTDPAPGVEISETCPTNARWRLISVLATLVTDATAANREAALTIDDGASVWLRAPSGLTQTATQTTRYNWHLDANRFTIAQDRTVTAPIPDGFLMGAFKFNTLTTGIVAGDNWGAPLYCFEEWIED